MTRKSLTIALLACALGGFGTARAQQTQSVAPGQPLPPEVKLFQGLEDKWTVAVVNKDQYAMELLLAPVYVGISSTGDVSTRNQQIADMFDKSKFLLSMEQRVVSVRMFGNTAVVSGTYDMKWRGDGPDREERGIFTHIYAQTQDRWECVNAQRTAVVDLSPDVAKKKKAKDRKSNAEEPFHIPLLHKGAESTQPASPQQAANPQS
ncbi:MAG: nuclear transport factor 2 family protein [Acidobacteriaceae bacterium]